jgi:hypothetical protein
MGTWHSSQLASLATDRVAGPRFCDATPPTACNDGGVPCYTHYAPWVRVPLDG